MQVCHVISSIGSTCSRNFMCICFTAAPTYFLYFSTSSTYYCYYRQTFVMKDFQIV